jgi:hypothetical protein
MEYQRSCANEVTANNPLQFGNESSGRRITSCSPDTRRKPMAPSHVGCANIKVQR